MADVDNVLYMRDQTEESFSSEDPETSDNEDMDIIIQGYNEITKVSHLTLAKEMSANSKLNASSPQKKKKSYNKNKKRHLEVSDSPSLAGDGDVWAVGMNCRATYEEDEQDYEAVITEIHHDSTCTIEFLGYKNVQLVYLVDLVPTWGKLARKQQEKDAAVEVLKQVEESDQDDEDNKIFTDIKPKSNRSKTSSLPHNYVPPPQWGPNIILPPQPPIPPMMAAGGFAGDASQDDAFSAMLMSWYMNGFYTGVYYAQNQRKQV